MSLLARQFHFSVIPRIRSTSRFIDARSVHNNFARRLTLSRTNLRRISLASGAVLGASLLLVQNVPDNTSTTDTGAKASIQDTNKPAANRQPPPLTNMLRSYVVYTMCCIPALVDWSPKILGTLLSIPVVGDVTELLVRVTFFAQVGYHVPSSFLI